ncbi:DUF1120 domain-containing protein [Serratia silvae]|uniref:DUF1120 domain-containing protein n=1 Tax=Serratia silvae TaxID=2824122 RepID=A0ABT0KH64_9GAMM|nr:DUF1120 domain-containing protein [Serratia silvae]MCL1031262.1 DUF1120 domain-containing protein [Serratia silvae]
MKKNVLQLTALSSLLFSAATLAADTSAEIKVVGELSTSTCEVTVQNNGVFDFGEIRQSQVLDDKATMLRTATEGGVNVKCSAPTALTFITSDNRLGTASFEGLGRNFGLGNVNGTGKMGFYQLQVRGATVDGKASRVFTAVNNNTIGATGDSLLIELGQRTGWAPASGEQEMSIGKDFAFGITARAYLGSKSDMKGPLPEDAKLDGSATMEFGFGL